MKTLLSPYCTCRAQLEGRAALREPIGIFDSNSPHKRLRRNLWFGIGGLRRATRTDRVVKLPNYQERHDLNMQPTDLKSDTLPIELLSLQLWFA